VDLLKGGILPAVPVKVDDTVATKDVIRTKSLSRAQITFVDNSVLTISPESRIAIEDYMVDTTKGKRRAVLQVFRGLALAVVNKIYKVKEPDFVIKTNTAIVGVRGTEIGIRIQPNSSTVLNFKGTTQVGNIFPEVSQLFLRAFKVAFAFGPCEEGGRWVCLKDMQGTTVARDLPPTLPFGLTTQDRELFMHQLTSIVPRLGAAFPESEKGVAGAGTPKTSVESVTPVTATAPGEQTILTVLNTVTVPPVLTPQPEEPSTQTFNFAEVYQGTYNKTSSDPYAVATYTNSNPGTGTRTGVYPSSFTAAYSIVATGSANTFSPFSTGTLSATSTATVTGLPGGILNGTMLMNATTNGGTMFNFSGPVTLNPNGNLTYQTNGQFNLSGKTGTTTGTWTQTNIPSPLPVAAPTTTTVKPH
jgi:hypothetical protein